MRYPFKLHLMCLALLCSSTSWAQAAPSQLCLTRAASVLAALDAGEFEQARVDFDEGIAAKMSAEQLAAVWNSLPQQVGKRLNAAAGRQQSANGADLAIIPLQYEKAWLELQVSCNAHGRIVGLFVRPGSAPESTPEPPADSSYFKERELPIVSGGLTLPATLTLPTGTLRAGMVLVHGSGPHDRDETIGPNKPFRDLAHGLAQRGIAVLRYEKRSKAHPLSFAGKTFTVKEEVTDDAVAALQLIAAQTELQGQPIYLLGHSLGALLAPRIAKQHAVAGMILLAAPARSLTDILPVQMAYITQLDGTVSSEEQAAIDHIDKDLAKVRALNSDADHSAELILGAPAAYWLDLRSYQPVELAESLDTPILLLQGEGDYQVTMADDFEVWRKALSKSDHFTAQSFAGLSHLFMPAGDPPGPADYEKAAHIDPKLIDSIANWVADR